MEWTLTLLPRFGLRVSSEGRRSISGVDGLLQKNDFFLALIVRLSDKEVKAAPRFFPVHRWRSDAFTSAAALRLPGR
jgi:hypothetical protein